MSESEQYGCLDAEETSICVVDHADKIVWRGPRVESTPEAISSAIKQHVTHSVRIGLETTIELAVPRVEAGWPLGYLREAPRQGDAVTEGQ
jgi:hypothetical protein